MDNDISAIVSAVSALIAAIAAGVTLWATFFQRGKLCMTRPNLITFQYDQVPSLLPKVFFRCALFSTATRGHVLENMYVVLRRNGLSQTFSVWGHTNTNGDLTPGSGLSVPTTGVDRNHHFNPPENSPSFRFESGEYELEIFGKTIENKTTELLNEMTTLSVPYEVVAEPLDQNSAIWFRWMPNDDCYHAIRVERGPAKVLHRTEKQR